MQICLVIIECSAVAFLSVAYLHVASGLPMQDITFIVLYLIRLSLIRICYERTTIPTLFRLVSHTLGPAS